MSRRTRIITTPAPGGPDALKIETRELDPPGPGEVLIDVAAAGVNRPDVFERMGLYPPPPGAPEGLGLEVSGHVRETGEGVDHLRPGDAVVALAAGGGYADIARADMGCVLHAPQGVDLIHAAGLPETVFTVWTNVFDRARLQPGERLLVQGGASGIGTTAIQMAAAHGARIAATAGSEDKCALCRELGAELALNYRNDDWETALRESGGADVILDMVGGDYTARHLSLLNTEGRLVMIAFLKGARVELDLMRVMLKRLTLTGSTLRSRSKDEKAAIARAVETHVWPWIAQGKLRPVIDSVFTLENAAKAHARMDAMAHAGKILLTP
ncbi:NAD(P)H-quinone oxidoreductase [Alkalicaulis satelles]|uniref:NAD(P)H-quinone oxidoreductase n=1 Tax=Alkalicaulis satelles TaxID=2609175 RepID=A0A5M6ZG70_9PROT|nr:NAD(P)H-quinone oxidoreductase [Alkalicaulis satelles]KAA5803746.1 NAD(P)H-quinone oxidoreductase [Alkalicaulis satelles]